MYSSPNGTIQGINQTEIAERHGVTPSCISYYIRTWTEDTDLPFPKPTCKVQQWITRSDGLEQWSRPFKNYDPWEVIVWFSKLDEASRRRRSKAQTASRAERKASRESRQQPVGVPIVVQTVTPPALEELTRRVTKLEETVIF